MLKVIMFSEQRAISLPIATGCHLLSPFISLNYFLQMSRKTVLNCIVLLFTLFNIVNNIVQHGTPDSGSTILFKITFVIYEYGQQIIVIYGN